MKVSFFMRILLLCVNISCLLFHGVLSNECKKPDVLTFARKLFYRLLPDSLPTTHVILVHESPPSECHQQCLSNSNCTAYFVDHENGTCTLIQGIGRELRSAELDADESSTYHRKVCLPKTECDHEWAFDEIQGVQLEHYLDKTIGNVTASEGCMAHCLSESTFVCRSAIYDEGKEECVLSHHDRRTASEVFRVSSQSVLYLQRQCLQEPKDCTFRDRHHRVFYRRHRHLQVVDNATTLEECERACVESAQFPCRSYTLRRGNPVACFISPEDASSETGPLEPNTIPEKPVEMYYEKESCVDVNLTCGPTAIIAVAHVTTPFRGRMYAASHPYECYSVNVLDDGRMVLAMPLHGRQCGTRNLGNGTFTNSVVIQHHPFVLRTTDKRIDMACDYEETTVKVRGAKAVDHGEMKPLAHTVTAVAPTPPIRLRVVNASDQDVTGVELGDPLFLKVELADESVYGIFGSDLVAMASAGTETVLLINEEGCPVEQSVIQAFHRLPGSKSLIAPFQAFKFASDSAVRFQMTVSYCLDTCPPVTCDAAPSSTNSKSFGRRRRRRRRSMAPLQEVLPGDVISDVTMESPTFLVTNLKPTLDTDQPRLGFRWEEQFQSEEQSEGHIHVSAPSRGTCISLTTLYVVGSVVGAVQLAVVCVCTLLFFYRSDGRQKTAGSTKSWPSVSSRRKLVCSQN